MMNYLRANLSRAIVCLAVVATTFGYDSNGAHAEARWSKEQAQKWHESQPWLVGSNFLPSNAINQLEMWQAESFDLETIDRELGWAASLGFNTVRVYLHDLPWEQDSEGFLDRIDKFLEVADKHGIRPMLVLFDGVWDPDPQSGRQPRPRPGIHNSGWVQSPGRYILSDPKRQDALKPYVVGVLSRFAKDKRVLVWDLFNEPDNDNANSYGPRELRNKDEMATRLVRRAFEWGKEVNPSQPMTVGLWRGPAWDQYDKLNKAHQAALDLSDVVSFHNYDDADTLQGRIDQLRKYGRPLLCTEYMARGNNSTFEKNSPVLKKEKVGAYNWGLVDGRSQTKYPWPTWQMPLMEEPDPWFHDIFHTDGTPYREEEVSFIKSLTGADE